MPKIKDRRAAEGLRGGFWLSGSFFPTVFRRVPVSGIRVRTRQGARVKPAPHRPLTNPFGEAWRASRPSKVDSYRPALPGGRAVCAPGRKHFLSFWQKRPPQADFFDKLTPRQPSGCRGVAYSRKRTARIPPSIPYVCGRCSCAKPQAPLASGGRLALSPDHKAPPRQPE